MSELTHVEKGRALRRVATYRPFLAAGIVVLNLCAALLEGVGLGFLLPILELAQSDGRSNATTDAVVQIFTTVYDFLGVPFTLKFVIVGVSLVMVVRYAATFLAGWLRTVLRYDYTRYLQTRAFENVLDARIAYFDEHGSDEVMNAIVTQAKLAGHVIEDSVRVLKQALMSLVYLGTVFLLAPRLTLVAGFFLGVLVFVLRATIESGYSVGDRVADANERLQETVQAGTQGIRDVKLFSLSDELEASFLRAVNQQISSQIRLTRNELAMDKIYQLITALTIFALIYVVLAFTTLSLAGLGVVLFAIFRLSPRVSNLNNRLYRIDGNMPHLVRTQQFVDELRRQSEPDEASEVLPSSVETVSFDDVSFSYDGDGETLRNVSFEVSRGEFVAFVGQSGTGKSTIVSLLARMYEPDSGKITIDGTPLADVDIDEWRSRIAVVQQNPFVFNETLRYNVTVGNRDASDEDVEQVCEIAAVTEFVDELPEGYDTVLGDDGVRLSGGQRQRVALARALLKDADLLILDEATSDLDTTIEDRVQSSIEAMDREFGIVTIAHRLSTVKNADRIYAMENGAINEVGTHEELLDHDGVYADLYAAQVGV